MRWKGPWFKLEKRNYWTLSLVELPRGEYDLVIMMPAKKDILGSWMEHHIYGDYYPMKKKTCFDKYNMPLLEEFFYALI